MGRPNRFIETDVEKFFATEGNKVLDLCCCSGLVTEGIQRTGAAVLGVDITKPSYAEFIYRVFLNNSPGK